MFSAIEATEIAAWIGCESETDFLCRFRLVEGGRHFLLARVIEPKDRYKIVADLDSCQCVLLDSVHPHRTSSSRAQDPQLNTTENHEFQPHAERTIP